MEYDMREIRDICDTVDWLYEILGGKDYDYDQVKQVIITGDDDYTTDITYDGDDFFDCRVGDMIFTIHQSDDYGYRVDDIAYYLPDDATDEKITVKL